MTPGENNLINPQCDILKDNWSVFSKKKKNQLIFFKINAITTTSNKTKQNTKATTADQKKLKRHSKYNA